LFPNLSKLNSSWQIEVLLATTRIVGMLCPGKNSIYAGLDLNFTSINENDSIQHRDLNFTVVRSDERFMAIWMDVEANGVTGRIKTYYRHPIVEQSTLSNVKHLVKQGEFKSHRALIVGGSRGLGELTAKIIGTGGGQLLLTYHKGQADAKRLANEMVNEKLSAETFNLDVTESYERLVEKLLIGFGNNRDITHLYYYATPWISKGQYGVFSSEKYLKFSNYYVSGFFNLIRALCHIGCKDYQIFYPSSEYVSVLPEFFVEYTTAKIAGESICRQITSHFPVKRPHFPRLPALLTDQSVGNIAVKKNNSLEIILNEIRMMQVN
jgi:hypothetical protein